MDYMTKFLKNIIECLLYYKNNNEDDDFNEICMIAPFVQQRKDKDLNNIARGLNDISYTTCFIPDDGWGYTDGSVIMYDDKNSILFKAVFTKHDTGEKDCDCKPTDFNYRPDKMCCGISCGWDIPVTYIESPINKIIKFVGLQKDFWTLEYRIKNKLNTYYTRGLT